MDVSPVESKVRLTLLEKFKLFKERLFNGRGTGEPKVFEDDYAQLLVLRKQLDEVLKSINSWLKSSKGLYKSAVKLARAVDTDASLFEQVTTDITIQMIDVSHLNAIKKKIAMLDNIIEERQVLIFLRHSKNRRTRKANKAGDKDEETIKKLKDIESAAIKRYDQYHAQLAAAIKFVISQAGDKGHCNLISPELAAFKLSQFHFFLNCQKLIQGSDKSEASNLDEKWNAFTEQVTETKTAARESVVLKKSLDTIPVSPQSIGGHANALANALQRAEISKNS